MIKIYQVVISQYVGSFLNDKIMSAPVEMTIRFSLVLIRTMFFYDSMLLCGESLFNT